MQMRIRGRRVALAAGAMMVMLGLPAAQAAEEGPRITDSVRATKDDKVPVRTYSSPSVVAHPEDPETFVAGFVEMRTRRCGTMRTNDAGRTWKILDSSPSLPTFPSCLHTSGGISEGSLAYGRSGTLYYALAGWDVEDGGPRQKVSVQLGRSTDDGSSWSTTIVRNARDLPDGEVESNSPVSSIAVDRETGDSDIVYVAWRQGRPDVKPAVPNRPMVATSTDGGRTFGEPVAVFGDHFQSEDVRAGVLASAPPPRPDGAPPGGPPVQSTPGVPRETVENFGGNTPTITVDGKGTLFAVWTTATANVDPAPIESPLNLSRSTDNGKTFTVTEIAPPASTYISPMLKWSEQGGPLGTLHLVFEAKLPPVQGDRDIHYTQSTDGGDTWTEPDLLPDDDPAALRGQHLPNLSIAPNGRLDVVWWDFRNDPGTFVNDVYYVHSTDNGKTWSKNLRMTEQSVNRRIGPWSNNFDIRQPPGIASTNDFALFAWDDTRNGTAVDETQDIYSAAAQYRAIGGGMSKAMRYALAAIAGLALVGLALLVATWAARRQPGDPPPLQEQPVAPPREPVGVG